jgi:hypothetical protein
MAARRRLPFWRCILIFACAALLTRAAPVTVEITRPHRDGGRRVSAGGVYAFDLNHGLEDLAWRGILRGRVDAPALVLF